MPNNQHAKDNEQVPVEAGGHVEQLEDVREARSCHQIETEIGAGTGAVASGDAPAAETSSVLQNPHYRRDQALRRRLKRKRVVQGDSTPSELKHRNKLQADASVN